MKDLPELKDLPAVPPGVFFHDGGALHAVDGLDAEQCMKVLQPPKTKAGEARSAPPPVQKEGPITELTTPNRFTCNKESSATKEQSGEKKPHVVSIEPKEEDDEWEVLLKPPIAFAPQTITQ